MPTNSESGKRSAIAIMLAPAAHPSSRTRHPSAGAGVMPNNNPNVSMRETSDAEIGRLSYGSASYASSSGSDISAEQKFVGGALRQRDGGGIVIKQFAEHRRADG